MLIGSHASSAMQSRGAAHFGQSVSVALGKASSPLFTIPAVFEVTLPSQRAATGNADVRAVAGRSVRQAQDQRRSHAPVRSAIRTRGNQRGCRLPVFEVSRRRSAVSIGGEARARGRSSRSKIPRGRLENAAERFRSPQATVQSLRARDATSPGRSRLPARWRRADLARPAMTALEYHILEPSSLQVDQNGRVGDQDVHQELGRAPSIHWSSSCTLMLSSSAARDSLTTF